MTAHDFFTEFFKTSPYQETEWSLLTPRCAKPY